MVLLQTMDHVVKLFLRGGWSPHVFRLVGAGAKLREQTLKFNFAVTRVGFETELAYRVLDVQEDRWHRFESADKYRKGG